MDLLPLDKDGAAIPRQHPDFVASVLFMLVTHAVLLWAPLFSGLLAGFLGGWRAGTLKRALAASVASTVVLVGGAGFLYAFRNIDWWRLFYGLNFTGWAILTLVTTAASAAFGAACNTERERWIWV